MLIRILIKIACVLTGLGIFFACSAEPDDTKNWLDHEIEKELHKSVTPDLTLEIFGQQFEWIARYPGMDGQLGATSYKLIDSTNQVGIDYSDSLAQDDFLVLDEIHLPVGKRIRLLFRSKDVIHSAYFPNFRLQMNVVPGLRTRLDFTPENTTEEMRVLQKNPEFNYMLFCNKICGASHFLMHEKLLIESESDFISWYKSK